MGKTFVTSDLHFNHDKDFIWKPRGCESVKEMNEMIISKWNEVVGAKDDVYILGDLMLGGKESIEYLKRLNGNLHIILGNHDSTNWQAEYKKLDNLVEMVWATRIKHNGYKFFLTHYPCLADNYDDKEKPLNKRIFNLCGHAHTTDKFLDCDKGRIYHCELDAHNCYPILLDDIIEDIKMYFEN